MDSGLEERILPSIRRSQMLLIYRIDRVVNPETFGQIACTAGTPARSETTRRPAVRSRARSGDRHDREEVQAARSERWGCVDNFDCFRADTGVCPYAFKYPEVGVTPRGYPPALAAM